MCCVGCLATKKFYYHVEIPCVALGCYGDRATYTHTLTHTHTHIRTHTQALTNSFGRESSSHSCSSSAEQEPMLSVSLFFSATSSCSISSRRLCRCSFIVSLRSCRCASSRPISSHTLVNCSKMGELSSSLSTSLRQVNSLSTEALEEMFSSKDTWNNN